MNSDLKKLAEKRWQRLSERLGEACPQRTPKMEKLIACSQAAANLIERYPQALSTDLRLPERFDDATDLAVQLRHFRNQRWLQIVYADLNRLEDTMATTAALSELAETCIATALDFHHKALVEEWGEPRDGQGNAQRMIVIAMGKLGAGELNLSSDIDLIFSYPQAGQTHTGEADNQQFFIRLAQRLIKALGQQTADGFVFRVDMRLRPYGQSGPLVISVDAMEEYYQSQGREWERYAMIKARCIDGPGEELMSLLTPFVYRRYQDFSALASLRDLKLQIEREVKRRNLTDDVKLGSGGIREVEFTAQCFQLIHGGHEYTLRRRKLLGVLAALVDIELMEASDANELRTAYLFLRDVEHAIQSWADAQTQKLPTNDEGQLALACAMGFEEWEPFVAELKRHRDNVSAHFSDLIKPPEVEVEHGEYWSNWQQIMDVSDAKDAAPWFAEAGYTDADKAANDVLHLVHERCRHIQDEGLERLGRFLPQLLDLVAESDKPDLVLDRVLPIVESIVRRSAYQVLLLENPGAFQRLVQLAEASPWISRQLALHPVLIEELIDEDNLYSVPELNELKSELYLQLLRVGEDDLETQMDTLRHFRLAHVLRVAASEVTGALPLMRVSDYLTQLAEVLLERVMNIAWQQMVLKHGQPETDAVDGMPFAILGYGKLGGIELSYGSDLDLVFVHDANPNGETDGTRPIANGVFFTRLGQRIIHIISTKTRLGDLYEVDMRLRPSGNSGLLVSSFSAFKQYQEKEAWTWEHQALVRSRVICGDRELSDMLQRVRHDVLCRERDLAALRQDVMSMREKMREHLVGAGEESEKNPWFDLKQGSGAIVDIEFMVQYAVLAWAHLRPELAQWSDNVRILASMAEAGLISADKAEVLTQAYISLRSHSHRLSLQQQAAKLPMTELREERAAVKAVWQQLIDMRAGELDSTS